MSASPCTAPHRSGRVCLGSRIVHPNDSFADALGRALGSMDRPDGAGLDVSDVRDAIRLQSAIYLHVERLELATRVLDAGIGAVKTVLQTRI